MAGDSQASSAIGFFNGLGTDRGGGQRSSDSRGIEMSGVPVSGLESRREPSNEQNEVAEDPSIRHKKQMRRYQSFSIALFAGVLTMSIFALSSAVKLNDQTKIGIIACFILMFLLSALVISVTMLNDNDTKEDDSDAAHAVEEPVLCCKPGVAISFVSIGLLVLVLYIVDVSFLVLYSYLRRKTISIVVGVTMNIIIFLVWVNIWKRPKCAYNFCLMAGLRYLAWKLVGGLFTFLGCAPGETEPPPRTRTRTPTPPRTPPPTLPLTLPPHPSQGDEDFV